MAKQTNWLKKLEHHPYTRRSMLIQHYVEEIPRLAKKSRRYPQEEIEKWLQYGAEQIYMATSYKEAVDIAAVGGGRIKQKLEGVEIKRGNGWMEIIRH